MSTQPGKTLSDLNGGLPAGSAGTDWDPTSLDPQDSPVPAAPVPPQTNHVDPVDLCIDWRHTCWHRDRRRVYDAMTTCLMPESRLERFAGCGSSAWVLQDKAQPDRLRVSANYCHDRWCTPCARTKARIVAGNLRALIGDHPHRFITLTLRATSAPLCERVSTLYAAFRRLRRSPLWRRCIRGGAAFCEPCWSQHSQSWHVHLHIIADGQYIPQADLSDTWLVATGDSYIVDVRLIRGHDQTVDYVTKYACKPLTSETVRDRDRLQEAMIALRSRRLVLPFGTWYHTKLTAVSDDTDWQALAPLATLLQRADAGDTWAQAIIRQLRGAQSCNLLDQPTVPP